MVSQFYCFSQFYGVSALNYSTFLGYRNLIFNNSFICVFRENYKYIIAALTWF